MTSQPCIVSVRKRRRRPHTHTHTHLPPPSSKHTRFVLSISCCRGSPCQSNDSPNQHFAMFTCAPCKKEAQLAGSAPKFGHPLGIACKHGFHSIDTDRTTPFLQLRGNKLAGRSLFTHVQSDFSAEVLNAWICPSSCHLRPQATFWLKSAA